MDRGKKKTPKPTAQEKIEKDKQRRPLKAVSKDAAAYAYNNLGRNIRTLRKGRKMSQEDVGILLGLHQTAVCRVEASQQGLTPEELFMFAESFEVSLDDLFKLRACLDGTFAITENQSYSSNSVLKGDSSNI